MLTGSRLDNNMHDIFSGILAQSILLYAATNLLAAGWTILPRLTMYSQEHIPRCFSFSPLLTVTRTFSLLWKEKRSGIATKAITQTIATKISVLRRHISVAGANGMR